MEFKSVVIAALLVLFPLCQATDYTVGGTSQWNLGVNYTAWTSGKTFRVNDKLVFTYGSTHDVLEVSKSAYDACQTSNPTKTYTGGSTTVTLNSTGNMYFICGTAGHCLGGMKLAVNVESAATGSSPAPADSPSSSASPSPSSSTNSSNTSPSPTTSTPSPTSSTPSSAEFSYVAQTKKMIILLVGSLAVPAILL